MCEKCKECVFAECDRKLKELGYHNKKLVLGCRKGEDIESEDCELFVESSPETRKEYEIQEGDEIVSIKTGISAIVLSIDRMDDFRCITEGGNIIKCNAEDGKLWEKTGRNFISILGMFKYFDSRVSEVETKDLFIL